MLIQLVYRSQIARQVRFEDAEEIAQAAAINNAAKGITGLLLYTPAYFLQVLEGEQDPVLSVFEKIRKDQRHQQVEVLVQEEIQERAFGAWTMKVALPRRELSAQNIRELEPGSVVELLRASC